MGATYSQIFPPTPNLTEKNVPSQVGRIFIVTGGYSGVGQALVSILYGAGATVYIAGRSRSKAQTTIDEIRSIVSTTQSEHGRLDFLDVDLSDMRTIKTAVENFKSRESRLDVLVNNAAVNMTPVTDKTAQGHELIMGTNCLGHFLLSLLLLPLLKASASSSNSPPNSTRVVWSSSQVVDMCPAGGIPFSELDDPKSGFTPRYTNSKTGNWFLASEFAKRHAKPAGILSLTQNPGALKTGLLRNGSWILPYILSPLLWEARYGAYTELFCAVDASLTVEGDSGGYVIPWGRLHTAPRQDLLDALKSKEDGGTGHAEAFWDWCQEQVKEFL